MSFCSGSNLLCNTKDTATLLSDDKFVALEEMVTIIPKYSRDEPVECIRGKFGPFRAGSASKVPLWLALEMERLQQCTVELPHWLHEEEMKRMRDEERADPHAFAKVPKHYIEVACAFLTQSKALQNDQGDSRRTVLLLRELIEVRRSKIVEGLKAFNPHATEMNVSGMSASELTSFRTRSLHALDTFYGMIALRRVGEKEDQDVPVAATQEDSSSMPMMV